MASQHLQAVPAQFCKGFKRERFPLDNPNDLRVAAKIILIPKTFTRKLEKDRGFNYYRIPAIRVVGVRDNYDRNYYHPYGLNCPIKHNIFPT